jgi:hypothetical protein
MVEVGNMAQVDVEEKPKKGKKAPKAQAAKAEKVEAAPEQEPEQTNGAKTIDELEVTEAASSTTEEPLTGQQKIYKDREALTEKMMMGEVEKSKLAPEPQYLDAPIFPDAYCPRCGQKLTGNSKTGFKMAFYTHPFSPSITLGKPCELKGKRLRAPVARMEIMED